MRASQAPRDETDGGLDSMLKDACRRKFDVVMAWAIDRLGRSLSDLLDTIQHLEACGVDLYLDQQAIYTTTPMGKLVFQLTGAFAEFERTMIRQRIKAGLKRAVAQGVKLGRPKIDSATERKVRNQLAKGVGILKVARSLGTGGVKAMSDEEIEQAIEMIKAMVDQKLGEKAKVIEGVAEPVSEPGPRRKAKRLADLKLTEPDDDGDNV